MMLPRVEAVARRLEYRPTGHVRIASSFGFVEIGASAGQILFSTPRNNRLPAARFYLPNLYAIDRVLAGVNVANNDEIVVRHH
jgi:hypothetical protein